MARRTRRSRFLSNTENRLIGFTTIDPNLNLGNGLNVENLSQLTTQLQVQLDEYNSTIVRLDQMGSQIKEQEKAIAQLSSKMLAAVGIIYGNDSDQYQMAGGKKRQRTGSTAQKVVPSASSRLEVNVSNGNGKKAKAIAL
jgi:TolA-binding protein